MKLKASNLNLTENQPKTSLTATATAADLTITVINSTGFADDDYLLIGKIGEGKTEIMQVNGTPTQTVITVDRNGSAGGLYNSHDIDTPITRIDYNQVRFYHGTTTVAADSTALAAAKAIDPSQIYTYYEDATYTTGYGFVRFYNSQDDAYSVYSDAINYEEKTGYTPRMLRSMRNKIRRLIKQTDEGNSDYTNDEINEEINTIQDEISHDRMWSFYEKTKSFSSVANQYEYSLASDVFALFDAMYDTQPLAVVDRHRMNILRWDSDVTGDPTHIGMWNRKAMVYPYPSSSADTTTVSSSVASTDVVINATSTTSFSSQGRILIDSEVISYTGKTSTTFTGCTRGDEGTTAASHTTTTTITERDFTYHFQEEPDDLEDETDETEIPEPNAIVYRVAADLSEGTMHDRYLMKADKAMAQLRRVDEPKIKRIFPQVRDSSEVVQDYGRFDDSNMHPTGLTGA